MSDFRRAVFYLGLVIAMVATFSDLYDGKEFLPRTYPRWVFDSGMYLASAIAAGFLVSRARVFSRLPPGFGWYALIIMGCALYLVKRYGLLNQHAWQFVAMFGKLLLVAGVLLVLVRLEPRPGTVYETGRLPRGLVFVAWVLLMSMSFRWDDFMSWPGIRSVIPLPQFPPFDRIIASAVVVLVLMGVTQVHHRRLVRAAGLKTLTAGIVVFAIGEIPHVWIMLRDVGYPLVQWIAMGAYWMRFAAHVVLFAGAFHLFANLLPRGAVRDEAL